MNEFTECYTATSYQDELLIMCKPNTDFDTSFRCWDLDNQEFLSVNGWLFTFDKI